MLPTKLEIAERLYQSVRESSKAKGSLPDTLEDMPAATQKNYLRYGEEVQVILASAVSPAAEPAPVKLVLVNLPMWSKSEGRAKIEELMREDISPAAIEQANTVVVCWPDNSFALLKGSAKIKVANATAANAVIDSLAYELAFKLNNPTMFSEGVRTAFEMYTVHVGKEHVPPEVQKASEI